MAVWYVAKPDSGRSQLTVLERTTPRAKAEKMGVPAMALEAVSGSHLSTSWLTWRWWGPGRGDVGGHRDAWVVAVGLG